MTNALHDYDAIVNLGRDCQTQFQLKKHGLQKEALPFDYLITPFSALRKILLADFEGYTASDNFLFVEQVNEKWVKDIRYETRLIHDFKLEPNFMTDFEIVKEKYVRRIDRFRKILIESQKILFVRKDLESQEALELEQILGKLYPHLDFQLAALTSNIAMTLDYNSPRIRSFYLRQPTPYVWSGDTASWRDIFVALQLL